MNKLNKNSLSAEDKAKLDKQLQQQVAQRTNDEHIREVQAYIEGQKQAVESISSSPSLSPAPPTIPPTGDDRLYPPLAEASKITLKGFNEQPEYGGSFEKPLVSFGDSYAQYESEVQQAAQNRQAILEQLHNARQQGANLRKVLFEKHKPTRNVDKEARLLKQAKIQAVGNLLSAIAAGAVGMSKEGYVPVTGNAFPYQAMQELNARERDYLNQNRYFQNLALREELADQGEIEGSLATQAGWANQEYIAAQRRLAELQKAATQGYLSIQQRAELEEVKSKIAAENARLKHQHNIELEKVKEGNRASADSRRQGREQQLLAKRAELGFGGTGGNKNRYSFIGSNGEEVQLNNAQSNYYYEVGVKLGLIPEDGAKQTFTTQSKRGGGRLSGTETTRQVAYNFARQSPEERTRLIKRAYDADYLLSQGFSQNEVIEYFSENQ